MLDCLKVRFCLFYIFKAGISQGFGVLVPRDIYVYKHLRWLVGGLKHFNDPGDIEVGTVGSEAKSQRSEGCWMCFWSEGPGSRWIHCRYTKQTGWSRWEGCPDVTRARIFEQAQEPGGSVGAKRRCQDVWQNLEQDARGRADNLEPAKSFPDVTRARILCEDCEQDQEPGGSVGGKTWCQNVWQNYWMSSRSRARMWVHRSGQNVRQAGAVKPMVDPHFWHKCVNRSSDRPCTTSISLVKKSVHLVGHRFVYMWAPPGRPDISEPLAMWCQIIAVSRWVQSHLASGQQWKEYGLNITFVGQERCNIISTGLSPAPVLLNVWDQSESKCCPTPPPQTAFQFLPCEYLVKKFEHIDIWK